MTLSAEHPAAPGFLASWRAWYNVYFAWRAETFGLFIMLGAFAALSLIGGLAYLLAAPFALARFGAEQLPRWLGAGRMADAAVLAMASVLALPFALALGARTLSSWRRFRDWPARASFRTEGWWAFVCAEGLGERRQWCPCRIEVMLDAAPADGGYRDGGSAAPSVHAALAVFVERANACYAAVTAAGEDPRVPWRVEHTSAAGSANAAVALALYELMTGPLDEIARRPGGVGRVRVEVGPFAWLSEPDTD